MLESTVNTNAAGCPGGSVSVQSSSDYLQAALCLFISLCSYLAPSKQILQSVLWQHKCWIKIQMVICWRTRLERNTIIRLFFKSNGAKNKGVVVLLFVGLWTSVETPSSKPLIYLSRQLKPADQEFLATLRSFSGFLSVSLLDSRPWNGEPCVEISTTALSIWFVMCENTALQHYLRTWLKFKSSKVSARYTTGLKNLPPTSVFATQ